MDIGATPSGRSPMPFSLGSGRQARRRFHGEISIRATWITTRYGPTSSWQSRSFIVRPNSRRPTLKSRDESNGNAGFRGVHLYLFTRSQFLRPQDLWSIIHPSGGGNRQSPNSSEHRPEQAAGQVTHAAVPGLDEVLLHTGQGTTPDVPRQHQSPPKIPRIVSQTTELESHHVCATAMAG